MVSFILRGCLYFVEMSKKSTTTEQILFREINGDFGVLKYIACQKLYNLYMKEWYFESDYLPLLYINFIHAVRQSSEVASWAIQIIENQYANEINSIVFVADRIADMFENGIIRDLVDKVKD